MNILYIDHYAGSVSMGMEFRPYYLAREWQKLGHKVRVIGADYSHLRKNNPIIDKDFEISVVDDIEYQWIKTKEYDGNGLSRLITMAQFCTKLYLNARKISDKFKPDIVIASSTYPMDAYAARRIALYSNGKYVHEVHDMWPITPIELYGMSPIHPFVRLVQHAEDYFCNNADKVVSILPCTKDYFMAHGMREEKFLYVANGIDLSDWETPEELPARHFEIINSAKKEGRFVLGFFGSHTRSYGLDYLIKALKMVDASKIFLAFVGDGNYKNELIEMADKLKLDKNSYCFLPTINKRAIPSLLKLFDASYVGAIKNRMFRFGIGMNKLFDSMMGGKPILYAVDAPNNIIEEYECGISVPAENSEALILGLEKLIDMSDSARNEMGRRGKDAALKFYTYPVLAKKFLDNI